MRSIIYASKEVHLEKTTNPMKSLIFSLPYTVVEKFKSWQARPRRSVGKKWMPPMPD